MNLAGGIFGCCACVLDISTNGYLETLRPLVAPSLCSGSLQPRALEPLVSMSNYYQGRIELPEAARGHATYVVDNVDREM